MRRWDHPVLILSSSSSSPSPPDVNKEIRRISSSERNNLFIFIFIPLSTNATTTTSFPPFVSFLYFLSYSSVFFLSYPTYLPIPWKVVCELREPEISTLARLSTPPPLPLSICCGSVNTNKGTHNGPTEVSPAVADCAESWVTYPYADCWLYLFKMFLHILKLLWEWSAKIYPFSPTF